MVIIFEVIKGKGDTITVTEGVVIEIKITVGIGVSHLKDRIEIGEIVEAHMTAGQCQILEQVQIEIGSDVSNVENMTILQENAQLDKYIGKQNRYKKCLIWIRIRQYYKIH